MSMSTLSISLDYGGTVREIYPDPYGQTYDCHLIDSRNPKTVQHYALEGLREFVKVLTELGGYDHASFSEVRSFVNNYVNRKTIGRWKYVSWNSKSYPD